MSYQELINKQILLSLGFIGQLKKVKTLQPKFSASGGGQGAYLINVTVPLSKNTLPV
jgi:hypothetical protein